jgi:hypothetical protein
MNELLQIPVRFGSFLVFFITYCFEFIVNVVTGPAKLFCYLSPAVSILLNQFDECFLLLGRPLALAVVFVELPLDEAVAAEGCPAGQLAGEYMEKLFFFEEGVDDVLLIQEDEKVLIACIEEVVRISR